MKSSMQKISDCRANRLARRQDATTGARLATGALDARAFRLLNPRYACVMQERRGSGWFGVPAMIGVLVVLAVVPHVYGLGGVLIAVVAVLVAFLIIGAAMTLANRR